MTHDKLVQKMRSLHKAGGTIYLTFEDGVQLIATEQMTGDGVISLEEATNAVDSSRGLNLEVREKDYSQSGYAYAPTLDISIPLHREDCMVTQDDVDAAYNDEPMKHTTDQRIPDWSMRENPIRNLELRNHHL